MAAHDTAILSYKQTPCTEILKKIQASILTMATTAIAVVDLWLALKFWGSLLVLKVKTWKILTSSGKLTRSSAQFLQQFHMYSLSQYLYPSVTQQEISSYINDQHKQTHSTSVVLSKMTKDSIVSFYCSYCYWTLSQVGKKIENRVCAFTTDLYCCVTHLLTITGKS